MKSVRFYLPVYFAILVAFSAPSVRSEWNDPLTGAAYDSLQKSQQVGLQRELERVLPESAGYFVTGPLDPFVSTWTSLSDLLFTSVRVVCLTPDLADSALKSLYYDSAFEIIQHLILTVRTDGETRPEVIAMVWNGDTVFVRLTNFQRLRADVWAKYAVYGPIPDDVDENELGKYALNVIEHTKWIASGMLTVREPQPVELGLPESLGLYAPPPDYVIQGYQNYKDSLQKYSPIGVDFAHDSAEFTASDSIVGALKARAPHAAYPNKEWPMFQDEFREFTKRGGSMQSIQTLTREGFDTLSPGEYFFAVGPTGKIRFGRELAREEVARLEKKTGQKVPRANHSFLFPGEYILAAGAFFVELENGKPRLTKASALSGHYFYSNVAATIQQDIAVRSDEYFLTLGHFFRSLDSLSIPYEDIRVSKM